MNKKCFLLLVLIVLILTGNLKSQSAEYNSLQSVSYLWMSNYTHRNPKQMFHRKYLKHSNSSPLLKWKGGKSFEYDKMYATVYKVVSDAPLDIRDPDGFVALILETACIESTFGEIVKQKRGPALGVFQMQPGTFRELQKSLQPAEKRFISKYKDEDLSNLDNLKFNIPYQVAQCILLYSQFDVHKQNLSSIDKRARLYKKHWNTPKGKATPSLFIRRANQHLSKYYI